MTGADALRSAIAKLRDAGIPGAARDARALLAHAAGIAPDRLSLHLSDDLAADVAQALEASIAARMRHQPIAQIVGYRLFWGRSFVVTPDVLDPRPETETLIEAALSKPYAAVLDLGTGSGCILLTLLSERAGTSGTGIDISPAALGVARQNQHRFDLQNRSRLHQSSWFDGLSDRFDLIVSNPPYIAADEMAFLSPDVRDWEPHLALTPGGDGLDAFRAITAQARAHLTAAGRLMVEIGPTQGAAVAGLFQAAGLNDIAILHDLDRRDRVVTGTAPV